MRILLVEDEVSLSNAIKKILEQNDYTVDAVYDGLAAIDYAKGSEYNLIILDVMLPKLDGLEVMRILRKDGVHTPVLILTARSTVSDKVLGLNSGADDYLTKPFDPQELVARAGALTRRTGEVILDHVRFGDLSLDLRSATLHCGQEDVQLSRKEFDVLKIFFYNPGMTITKDLLLDRVWGVESDATDNNVEVYISFLRKKLKYLQSSVSIKNIQRIGYRLEVAP